jgi:SNF2 family DNA or RNA helicase
VPMALLDARISKNLAIIPHNRESTRLLRNVGIPAPSPILHHYKWPGILTPLESQKKTAALLSMNRRAYVLSTMGCGKTRAALFAADYLMMEKEISKCLVIAPLSTLSPTWMNEIFMSFPNRRAVVLHGTKARRLKLLAEDADFYIINHDGVLSVHEELIAKGFDAAIIDELAVYREKTTDRWKACRKVIQKIPFVWGLTGAPTPNKPTDAYAQAALIRPETVGAFTRFRDATMRQITQFKWVDRPEANDIVHNLLQPSVRYTLEECVDIPETTYSTREVPMSKPQEKFYKRMVDHLSIQYKQHQINAVNEGVKLGKLLQVSTGYIYTDDKRVLGLKPTPKLNALKELLAESERKVIVFVPFRHAVAAVTKHITDWGYSVATISSGVSKTQRDQIFNGFQNGSDPHVIVANAGTMSHGLTLTAATMIVWFGPTNSLDTYIQANARIARPGQKCKTVIVHLSSSAVEKKTFKRLQARETVQGTLLEMFDGVKDTC